MELIVKPIGNGVQFEAETRGHRIVSDQPRSNGGDDAGMTPPELLLASLGTCAGYYALQYLRSRSLPTDDLRVKVSAEKLLQPARLDQFRLDIQTPTLEPRQQEGLQRAVEKCLIHNTLRHTPGIQVALHTSEPPVADAA